jgi:hypothetical protein
VPLAPPGVALEQIDGPVQQEVERIRTGALNDDLVTGRKRLVRQLSGGKIEVLLGDVAQEVREAQDLEVTWIAHASIVASRLRRPWLPAGR